MQIHQYLYVNICTLHSFKTLDSPLFYNYTCHRQYACHIQENVQCMQIVFLDKLNIPADKYFFGIISTNLIEWATSVVIYSGAIMTGVNGNSDCNWFWNINFVFSLSLPLSQHIE